MSPQPSLRALRYQRPHRASTPCGCSIPSAVQRSSTTCPGRGSGRRITRASGSRTARAAEHDVGELLVLEAALRTLGGAVRAGPGQAGRKMAPVGLRAAGTARRAGGGEREPPAAVTAARMASTRWYPGRRPRLDDHERVGRPGPGVADEHVAGRPGSSSPTTYEATTSCALAPAVARSAGLRGRLAERLAPALGERLARARPSPARPRPASPPRSRATSPRPPRTRSRGRHRGRAPRPGSTPAGKADPVEHVGRGGICRRRAGGEVGGDVVGAPCRTGCRRPPRGRRRRAASQPARRCAGRPV